MCLAPRIIVNNHYLKVCDGDRYRALCHFGTARDFYIKVDCGLCIECQRKRGNMWRTRLLDEYKYFTEKFPDRKVMFCTLTCAPEHYEWFAEHPNEAIRLFLERYRKRYGCSFRHWITSEFGEKRGRLHLHMIAFGILCSPIELRKLWSYGRVDMQTLKGPQGLTYVSGYITKVVKGDKLSKKDIPLFITPDKKVNVWTSPGLGKGYALDYVNRNFHNQKGKQVYIRQRDNGSPFALPRYYLDKLFSPIDIYRRKQQYFVDALSLPRPPYRANTRSFESLSQYFDYVRKLGGKPLIMSVQFHLLTKQEKQSYFYGKQ